jgi:hypothetical protein
MGINLAGMQIVGAIHNSARNFINYVCVSRGGGGYRARISLNACRGARNSRRFLQTARELLYC